MIQKTYSVRSRIAILSFYIIAALLGPIFPAAAFAQPSNFDAVPRLPLEASFEISSGEDVLSWIEPRSTGLYEIIIDGPGVLSLFTFNTESGRADGDAASREVISKADSSGLVALGPLLLTDGHPYLLRARSAAGVLSLRLRVLDELEALDLPEEVELVGSDSRALVTLRDRMTSVPWTGETREPVRIEAYVEPRARVDISIDGNTLDRALYPYVASGDTEINLRHQDTVGAPPLVLLRTVAAPEHLEEIEPNSRSGSEPNRWNLAEPFDGVLLAQRDTDRVSFQLDANSVMSLHVESPSIQSSFHVRLERLTEGGNAVLLAERADSHGSVAFSDLALSTGQYLLILERTDRGAAHIDWRISSEPGMTADRGFETEPNDSLAAAEPLGDLRSLRVQLGPQDPSFLRFEVSKVDHLWRVAAIGGVARLTLFDSYGDVLRDHSETLPAEGDSIGLAPGSRIVFDALALVPGEHSVELRGTGSAMLRIIDLGPAPQSFEAEPNDSTSTAMALNLGDERKGAFDSDDDEDRYRTRLATEMPLRLSLTAPADGAILGRAWVDGEGWEDDALVPAGETYVYEATFPAGDLELLVWGETDDTRDTYAISLSRGEGNVGPEPDTDPGRSRVVPRDGLVQDTIGQMDSLDAYHLPLPEGQGILLISCADVDPTGDELRWRVRTYGDDEQLIFSDRAPGRLRYGPELGGAVRLTVEHDGPVLTYRCLVRAPAEAMPTANPVDGEGPHRLAPGSSVSGSFVEQYASATLELDLSPGQPGLVWCQTGDGAPLDLRRGPVRLSASAVHWAEEPSEPVALRRTESSDRPSLHVRGGSASELPFDWQCTLLAIDDLQAPAAIGPPAPFDALSRRAEAGASEHLPVRLLKPGRPDWLPETQPGGDLPVEITIDGLETLAAYAAVGQTALATVAVTNASDTPRETTLEAQMLAEGWRIDGAPLELALAPGQSETVQLRLRAPPMLSPPLKPALSVHVSEGPDRAVAVAEVPLDTNTLPQRPAIHWSAPPALRGGLNMLAANLGGRVLARDGEEVDADEAEDYAFIHDGIAPAVDARRVFGRELVFAMPEIAPAVGAMFHLRTTTPRQSWPGAYEIALSADREHWEVVAEGSLDAVSARQFDVFDASKEARFVRLRVAGCRADPECDSVALQEFQVIAEPGWRPARPLDLARPGLGGHVVHATADFGGNWNERVLSDEGDAPTFREKDARWEDTVTAVIGFDRNRAAQIGRVEWHGREDDGPRFGAAALSVSLEGPGGPWTPIGALNAPAEGEVSSTFRLPEPVWARYLRLDFQRDDEESRTGPARVSVVEAEEGPTALGLWEDERPQGPFEAIHGQASVAELAPAGGADVASAELLPLDRTVASSVQVENNEDWWYIEVPEGAPRRLDVTLADPFGGRANVAIDLRGPNAEAILLEPAGDGEWTAVLGSGRHLLRVSEPPRSVVLAWDTSGSVSDYIPRTLDAVRLWSRSLKTGRDTLQLLPFGRGSPILDDWAEAPEDVLPVLSRLPQTDSSDAEGALKVASEALASRDGTRGVVLITDNEASYRDELWPALLKAAPRVIAISMGTDGRAEANRMIDWTMVSGGWFQRVIGDAGLIDGLDMAAALFRSPKPYALTATLQVAQEPEGETTLTIAAEEMPDDAAPTGAVEVILDASGSMLQRMEGRRRIEIAHDALEDLVKEAIPAGAPFAFRAFGLEIDACQSELRVPLGALEPAEAANAIRDVPAINLAKTAIADSLLAARQDLADARPPRVLVIVTDGEETCEGDVEAAIEALRGDGFDVAVNIVGFAIDDDALAATFADWAELGGGTYFAANDSDALSQAVRTAIAPRFAVVRERLDGEEEAVGSLGLGEQLTVPAGRLRIEPRGAAVGDPLRVAAKPGAPLHLRYAPTAGLDHAER